MNLTEQYKKASKAEKRVILAKDALKQLNAEKFIATSGVYVRAGEELKAEIETKGTQKALLARDVTPCRVCAKGALFLSRIRAGNTCDLVIDGTDDGDYYTGVPVSADFDTLQRTLSNLFGEVHIDSIEDAFEAGDWDNTYGGYGAYRRKIGTYGLTTEEDGGDYLTLRSILENIIRNGGRFKPNDITKAEAKRAAKLQEAA